MIATINLKFNVSVAKMLQCALINKQVKTKAIFKRISSSQEKYYRF